MRRRGTRRGRVRLDRRIGRAHDPHGDDEAGVDATDDPVRMYLMQMGADSAAQPGRGNRRRPSRSSGPACSIRHSMLATDYVLQGAVEAAAKRSATASCGSTARSKSR